MSTHDLILYIARLRAAGKTDEWIREQLHTAGWDEGSIVEAFTSAVGVNAPENPQIPVFKNSRTHSRAKKIVTTSIFIAVACVTAGVGAYFVITSNPMVSKRTAQKDTASISGIVKNIASSVSAVPNSIPECESEIGIVPQDFSENHSDYERQLSYRDYCYYTRVFADQYKMCEKLDKIVEQLHYDACKGPTSYSQKCSDYSAKYAAQIDARDKCFVANRKKIHPEFCEKISQTNKVQKWLREDCLTAAAGYLGDAHYCDKIGDYPEYKEYPLEGPKYDCYSEFMWEGLYDRAAAERSKDPCAVMFKNSKDGYTFCLEVLKALKQMKNS